MSHGGFALTLPWLLIDSFVPKALTTYKSPDEYKVLATISGVLNRGKFNFFNFIDILPHPISIQTVIFQYFSIANSIVYY